MSLGSILGKLGGFIVGGPVGATIGGALGSRVDERRSERRQDKRDADYFKKLRAAALRGGFHPLEALSGGAAGGYAPMLPPLASPEVLAGSFDQIDEILTGRQSELIKEQAVAKEIDNIDGQRQLAGGAGHVVKRTMGKFNLPEGVVMTTQGPKAQTEIAAPTPITEEGRVDVKIDDGGTGVSLKPRERVVLASGETVDVTVGPDIDELASGLALEAIPSLKRMVDKHNRHVTPHLPRLGSGGIYRNLYQTLGSWLKGVTK